MEESGMLDQKEYAFPTSSSSMYATTSYLAKDEAKTSSITTTMPIPKSQFLVNTSHSGTMSTCPTLRLNLLNPLSTVKQCESTCPQEVDNLFKNCYDKEHNPMPETHQIVSKFMNMFGSMWVVGTSMTSAVLTLSMMPKLFVNQIQCGQDIMLCLSHLMIMFFVFRVDNRVRYFSPRLQF
uniref:Uncharacterized protein n=1 Tax=Romanomermis culicivorax TaxID=13658 RepID=A0A915KAU9_ROMCU